MTVLGFFTFFLLFFYSNDSMFGLNIFIFFIQIQTTMCEILTACSQVAKVKSFGLYKI